MAANRRRVAPAADVLRMTPFGNAVCAAALSQLKTHWRAALVVITLGVLTIGLLGPVRTLGVSRPGGEPAIALPPIASAGPALMWTPESRAPSEIQNESLGKLLHLLWLLGWLGFGVASVSVFSCRAAEARERAHQTAVQRAVGASLKHVVLSVMLETVVLAAIALVIGLAMGDALLSIGRHWWPGTVGALESAGPAAALALSAVLGAAGLSSLGLVRSGHLVEPPSHEVSLTVPAYQVAVAVALLMGSAALLTSPRESAAIQETPAWTSAGLFRVDSGIESSPERAGRYASLIGELSKRTGVSAVSLTSAGFPVGLGTMGQVTTDCGLCYFGLILIRWPWLTALVHAVSADSFRAQGIPLIEGREFAPGDSLSGERVAIINRHLAVRYFQDGKAIGRNLFLGPGWPETPYKVVGIVDDRRAPAIGGSLQPRETLYLSVLQHPPERVELLVTQTGDAPLSQLDTASLAARVLGSRSTVNTLGGMAEYLGTQFRAVRWIGASFGVAAAIVLLMALLGTVATSRMWADSLAWEMALRRAVGATRNRMRWFVVVRTATIGGLGGLLGLFFYGVVLAPALAEAMPGLPLGDARLLGRAAIVPVLLALIAGTIPGLRLLRKPPSAILR